MAIPVGETVPAAFPRGRRENDGDASPISASALDQVVEMTALQLAEQLQSDDQLQVLDVRLPHRVATGRIDVPANRFFNIVGSQVCASRSLDGTGIDTTCPLVVVCGHGHDSKIVAAHLNQLGYAAVSLHGGMAAWMQVVVPRPLVAPPSLDRLLQFDRPGKGSLAYLLISDGEALVIDAPRDASAMLEAAGHLGAHIVAVADTHVHADYISGSPLLSSVLGAPYYLHPDDAISPYDGTPGILDYIAIGDEDLLRVGRSLVRVMHTPGHTAGSVCFIVDDELALTGDFLFVRSIGRPDLGGKPAEWTEDLWHSLRAARREWRSEMRVCPAHYQSRDDRQADGAICARFGEVVERCEALRLPDRAAFSDWVSVRIRPFPETYRRIKGVNLGLENVDDQAADELEFGRNECAVSG